MEKWLSQIFKEGNLSLPVILVKEYKELGLTDQEMMLIIQILTFNQEGKDFPTIQELASRMTAEEIQIINMLQKLVQKGYMTIEDVVEKGTGIRSERYQLDALYEKLSLHFMSQLAQPRIEETSKPPQQNLFTIFEQEFGRPLSPIECETLAMWQDQDHYTDELIIAALREAVISNKMFFRYIDRILYEWQRNQIRTPQQARDFSLKFRKPPQAAAVPKKVEPFPFYNWLENESGK
ncbi:DnaD domain-containing protein [Ammoniphilus sp. CFH 90114]|uniref:DnaD domain-containing protein n=1 Tax=Ammoniphilus sp. CFH 90114 TaxID=2493665 RepID=UPI0013E99BBE|nr:DnaD domain-containing protein [Ammoniphilus sp. CFH 90114]